MSEWIVCAFCVLIFGHLERLPPPFSIASTSTPIAHKCHCCCCEMIAATSEWMGDGWMERKIWRTATTQPNNRFAIWKVSKETPRQNFLQFDTNTLLIESMAINHPEWQQSASLLSSCSLFFGVILTTIGQKRIFYYIITLSIASFCTFIVVHVQWDNVVNNWRQIYHWIYHPILPFISFPLFLHFVFDFEFLSSATCQESHLTFLFGSTAISKFLHPTNRSLNNDLWLMHCIPLLILFSLFCRLKLPRVPKCNIEAFPNPITTNYQHSASLLHTMFSRAIACN